MHICIGPSVRRTAMQSDALRFKMRRKWCVCMCGWVGVGMGVGVGVSERVCVCVYVYMYVCICIGPSVRRTAMQSEALRFKMRRKWSCFPSAATRHTSAYVSIRQHTYVSIRQHTPAYVPPGIFSRVKPS